MSTPPPPAHTLNLSGVLSQSKRIINAHSRHFLALSVLFLLPFSFSLIIFPTLTHLSFPQNDVVTTQFFVIPQTPTILPLVLYFLFLYLIFIGALATITYSTLHGFYGRPVRFFPAIKSLTTSFLPLVSTTVASHLLLALISLAFLLSFIATVKTAQTLGFDIETDYDSTYFIVFSASVAALLGLVIIHFQANWSLACVIVVAESDWGFQPLRRSSYLVKGMRSVSLSLLLIFGVLIGVWVWMNSSNVLNLDVVGGGWRSWPFVLQTVIGTSLLTLLLLYNTAVNAVFYMYCKALHGELAVEIAEEFAREYVSLPFDHQKVPHVVSVISA